MGLLKNELVLGACTTLVLTACGLLGGLGLLFRVGLGFPLGIDGGRGPRSLLDNLTAGLLRRCLKEGLLVPASEKTGLLHHVRSIGEIAGLRPQKILERVDFNRKYVYQKTCRFLWNIHTRHASCMDGNLSHSGLGDRL